ncbi:hypothetical protein LTS03_010408 [Exophiala xenobiotica]|nr:hypothetical protein LTS06_010409 [Exophiala xenobiotica]KAK5282183.1 hypothetical protein LTR40_003665 [Exophiala xenobiotica]KAK5347936.1 hypothetical protein LTR61_008188 [Exophiala xenobiotica]KAK5361455.1 hypothetical protein LTS03_010408 [Exophiala xenobiotica]KAK5401746.1 hypothetical protein LTR06_010853 [Exophiala xenobiotica]
MGSLPVPTTYEVVIAGAGFSGLYLLHRLRTLGFSVRIFEAGSSVGGTWYWNCYPGARVDTEVPAYQFSADETYFKHVDRVWNLSRDISYDSRITAAKWDDDSHEWTVEVNGGETVCRSRFMVLCTGFAAKAFVPPFRGLDRFQGVVSHTAEWPQEGIDVKGKRVAVFGTGASGVQVIQQIAGAVSHMTVFQRTPNLALPMGQRQFSEDENRKIKEEFPGSHDRMANTFAGHIYEFAERNSLDVSEAERRDFYQELWDTGGLKFWLGNFKDVLFDKDANQTAYEFWRGKVRARLHNLKPELVELLAPTVPPHPFGAKRVSLERGYYEAFNRPNVDIVSLLDNPVDEITTKGVRTKDGTEHEFDVIVLATGFQPMSAGITGIDIRGVDGATTREKWKKSIRTYLGMTVSGFPNMFFVYGPQAPTAFATGTSAAEFQGDWVTDTVRYMQRERLSKIDATPKAEEEWRIHCNEVGKLGLFDEAQSWYFKIGEGGTKEALNYMAGLPVYRDKCWSSTNKGYEGFTLS